ncbi:MAG: hypothetical protein WCH32_16600 [Pseudomonadota bacterium]
MSTKPIFLIGACAMSLLTLSVWLDKASSSAPNEAAEDAAGTLVSATRKGRAQATPPATASASANGQPAGRMAVDAADVATAAIATRTKIVK